MTLLEHAPCGIIVFDDERRIVLVNRETLGVLGYTEEGLLGRSIDILLPVPVRILFQATVYPVLAEGERVDELYVLLSPAEGLPIPVLLSVSREPDAARSTCVFLVVRRRTAFEHHLDKLRMRTDGAIEQLRRESEASAANSEALDRMATLGMLTAGIGHELRNPLSFASSNMELISEALRHEGTMDLGLLRDCVADVEDGLSRIRGLIAAIGVASRAGPESIGPVDVGRAIETAAHLVRHRVMPHAQLRIERGPSEVWAMADEGRLVQVLVNLIINATQALEQSRPERPLIRVQCVRQPDTVDIVVTDNGPGIPPGMAAEVFRPFFTTKPIGEGTGLGLAISRQIVSSFGGALGLERPDEAGASFRIELRQAELSPSRAG